MPVSSPNISSKRGTANDKSTTGKNWGILLFGFIFFAVGITVAAFTLGNSLLRYYETENWVRVPATITSLNLHTHHDDDSVTWSVDASYQYEFNGRTYHGDRVALTGGSDNIGDYWQMLYSRLKSAQQRDQVRAYVNPANPQEAYLDRTLRVRLMAFGGIFGVIFILVGGGVIFMGHYHQGDSQYTDGAGISSDQRGSYKILLFIGGLFVLILAPLLFIIFDELQDGKPEVLLTLIFPLVGSGAIYGGLRMRKRYLQIGPTLFYPDPLPGNTGGQVGGYFHLASGEWIKQPQVRLTCVHIYSTSRGKESKTHQDVIWQGKGRTYCELNNSGCDVHVLFDVPAGLPGSGSQSGYRGRIQWNLYCEGIISMPVSTARNPQVDNSRAMRSSNRQDIEFKRSWSIPVEKGLQVSSFQMPVEEPDTWHQQQRADASESAAAQITMTAAGSGMHLDSAAGRHTGMAMGLLLFGLVFDGIGSFLLYMALQGELMLWLMGPVFLLVGLLVTWLGVFWLGRGLEADVEPGRVRVVRRLFGIALYHRSAAVSAASPLSLEMGMSSGNQNGIKTEYFSLLVEADGQKVKLAEGIEGREAAEVLKEKVRAVLTRELDSELI